MAALKFFSVMDPCFNFTISFCIGCPHNNYFFNTTLLLKVTYISSDLFHLMLFFPSMVLSVRWLIAATKLGSKMLDGSIPSDRHLTAVVTLDPELWRVEHISPDSAMMYPIRQFVHHLGQPLQNILERNR